MRFAALLFIVAIAGGVDGQEGPKPEVQPPEPHRRYDPEKLRAARAAAEATVRPSGPVRLGDAVPYIAPQWQPRVQLAGTYRDPQARHRHVETTFPWFGPYAYRCRPYSWWRAGWY